MTPKDQQIVLGDWEAEDYKDKIQSLPKPDLLNEMLRFQEQRQTEGLTPQTMVQGRVLFDLVERTAETQQLKSLSQSIKKGIDQAYLKYLNKLNQEG